MPSPGRGRAAELRGRLRELGVLDRLIEAVRAGESQVLVLGMDDEHGDVVLVRPTFAVPNGSRLY